MCRALLEPLVGERTAHQLGTLAVVVLFGAAIWLIVPWIEPELNRGRLIALGIGWAVATVLFELGFGHWVAAIPGLAYSQTTTCSADGFECWCC